MSRVSWAVRKRAKFADDPDQIICDAEVGDLRACSVGTMLARTAAANVCILDGAGDVFGCWSQPNYSSGVERELQDFVTHRFDGDRFKLHAMPVEVLAELEAYRRLVVVVARHLFFKRNPDRRRVSPGFEDSFQLVLQSIGKGSAKNKIARVMERPTDDPQLDLMEWDLFDEANELILGAFEAAANGKTYPDFPNEAIDVANRFGSTLRAGEFIELAGRHGKKANWDRDVKKRLVLQRFSTYEDEADEVGHVVMFDQAGSFILQVDGRRIEGKFGSAPEDSIKVLRAASAEDKILVRVVGRCARDSDDQLIRFTVVDEVTYAEDEEMREVLNIESRLDVLAGLPRGWFDGKGEPLDTDGLQWARGILSDVVAEGVAKPYLYPTVDGGLLAEWSFPDAEVSAEFDFKERHVFLVGTKIRAMAKADAVASDAMSIVSFVARFGPDGMVSTS